MTRACDCGHSWATHNEYGCYVKVGSASCDDAYCSCALTELPRWKPIADKRPVCDLCGCLAKYAHPNGGLRCGRCKRS